MRRRESSSWNGFVHLVLPRLQFRTSLQEEKDGQTHLRRSLSNQDCLYMSYCTCCNCYFYVPRAHVSIRLLIPALCEGDTKARCPGGKSQKWYCIWCSSSICKRKLRCTGIYIYIPGTLNEQTFLYLLCLQFKMTYSSVLSWNVRIFPNRALFLWANIRRSG